MQIELFLLFLIFIKLSFEYATENGERTVVKVGAIFFKDESDTELSFDETFYKINNLNYFEIEFELIKRYMAEDDSLRLQKITCELIKNGVGAIFGPSSKASSDIVALIASANGISHIQYDSRIEESLKDQYDQYIKDHRLTINVAPSAQTLASALYQIVRDELKWEKFTIIYQTELGLASLQDVLKVRTLSMDQIKLRRLLDYKDDYRVLFKELEETLHETHFILECDPQLLGKLIELAKPYKLFGDFRNWFFTHLDTHNSKLRLMYDASFTATMTAIRLKNVDANPFERKKMRFTLYDELLKNQTLSPILMHDAVILYANAARKVIKDLREYYEPQGSCEMDNRRNPWPIGEQIIEEMKNLPEDEIEPPLKTENMAFNEMGKRIQFNLEIYKPSINQPLLMWQPNKKIEPIKPKLADVEAAVPVDFSAGKKFFMVGTHLEPPYFMRKDNYMELRGIDKYKGFAVDLMQELSERMEFAYDFKIYPSNGKYNEETKKWDGIIGGLINHEVQIGIADMTIMQARREVVDFTVPFMQLGIAILYYQRPQEPKSMFAFMEPFSIPLWCSLMLADLVMTLLFVFIARISYYEYRNPRMTLPDSKEVKNKWDTHNSYWLMVGSIMQQGCDILPRGPPMRILTGVWWFFAMMVVSTYTASLAAFLTNNKMQTEIKSLEDLIDQSKVKFGTLEGGSTYQFFKDSNHSIYMRAWNKMKTFEPTTFMKSNKDGVIRVQKEKGSYAYLMETTSILYNTERNSDLQKIGSQIGEKHYALAVYKGAPYRTNLSVSLLELGEQGKLLKMKNEWWNNPNATGKTKGENEEEIDGTELSIIELGGVFYCLGGGILLAIIIGLLEFFWNIRTIAVNERVTPWRAFKAECDFAWRFWLKRKPKYITEHYGRKSQSTSHHSHHSSRGHSRGHSKAPSRGHSRARDISSRASSKTRST